MNATVRILGYAASDLVRSRWVVAYAAFFLLLTDALFRFGGSSSGALLSLMNVVLLLLPLVSVVFGTMYLYDARAFIELLLSQPVDRRALYVGLYAGLAGTLAAGFAAGVGLPFLWHRVESGAHYATLGMLVLAGVLLTGAFVAFAFVLSVRFEDRVRGLGLGIVLWLGGAVLYDGLVLVLAATFADYPLEKPMIGLTLLNPVDLGRVLLLLRFDISALMGYTGAVFERFFGTGLGVAVSLGMLLAWVAAPFAAGLRLFLRKDF